MIFEQATYADSLSQFKQKLVHRLKELATETGENDFTMPVGIFLLIDEDHGGDSTAKELAKRFKLLDSESRNIVDFYFFGWVPNDSADHTKAIKFDLKAFVSCRDALRNAGISKFNGNADLILVDARYTPGSVTLDFSQAIHVDLSRSQVDKEFPTLGGFLQSIIDAADGLRQNRIDAQESLVMSISDRLGLAIAKKSLLEFIYENLGKLIGAKQLAAVAVRDIGPNVRLADLK